MFQRNACKICRRLGQKNFLKGEKCLSPKCPFIKRSYPPGPKRKRSHGSFSEYSKELNEKQKLQKYYGLREGQFHRYVKSILRKRGQVEDATLLLVRKLEQRLDNVIFRLGLAKSREEARQLVSHGHFLVNSRAVNIPSSAVKKGTVIRVKNSKRNKAIFKNVAASLKNYQTPSWLKIDAEKMEGEVIGEPTLQDVGPAVDISSIFEFYSR